MRDQLSKYKWNFLTWPNHKYYTMMGQETVHKQFTPSTWATTLRNSNTPSNWAWRCTQAPQRPIGHHTVHKGHDTVHKHHSMHLGHDVVHKHHTIHLGHNTVHKHHAIQLGHDTIHKLVQHHHTIQHQIFQH